MVLRRFSCSIRRKPIGIIYARDALQRLLGEAESDEALLRDHVMDVGYKWRGWQ